MFLFSPRISSTQFINTKKIHTLPCIQLMPMTMPIQMQTYDNYFSDILMMNLSVDISRFYREMKSACHVRDATVMRLATNRALWTLNRKPDRIRSPRRRRNE